MAITKSVLVQATTKSTSLVRNYTEKYLVSTDGPTTDLRSIVEYKGSPGLPIPVFGKGFDGDTFAVVIAKSAQPTDSTRTQFVVTVEYGPYQGAGHNHSADEFDNPLDAPPEYTWGFSSRQEVITHDANQAVIVNTARDQFIPAVEKTVYDLQLTVVQNLEDFKPLSSWEVVNKVNSKTFTVASLKVPEKAALLTERSGTSEVFEDSDTGDRVEYWVVNTVIVFRMHDLNWKIGGVIVGPENAWFKRILNAGLDQLVNDKQQRITVDSQEVTEPKLLKVDGTYEADPEGANWIAAEIYETYDFGRLAL